MFDRLTPFGGLFDELRRVQEQMDTHMGRWPYGTAIRSVARGEFPAINVGATPETVDVFVFASGIDSESLEVTLHENVLTVAGDRTVPSQEDASYYRQERFSGSFRRTITLPDDVDPDRVEAKYRDGVLQISVQRRQAIQPRRIDVA